jgi:short-subunit dehydrogenase
VNASHTSRHWRDKVVIVTGGSGGLGRAIAGAFAECGASVVLSARGADALNTAADEMRQQNRSVLAVPCDVTDQQQVERLIAATIEHFGRIDVLVNNAGRSMRREAIETTPEDFRDLLELNLIALVRCTRAAMPELLKHRGSVVNIGSLAAKSAARYVGAYPATKFAVAAYSQQLRLELGPQGLHVLLVNPGPIARHEPRAVPLHDTTNLPEAAKKPGAGVKTRAIDPDWLARRIVRACERREPELVVPSSARLLFALAQLSPRLGDWLVRRFT